MSVWQKDLWQETLFSLVLNFKAGHIHPLAREGDRGSYEFLFPVSSFDTLVFQESLYNFSRLSQIGSLFCFFFQEPTELCVGLRF